MCAHVEDAGGGLQPQQCLSESVGSEVIRRSHLGAASQGAARDEEDNGEQGESMHPEILRRDQPHGQAQAIRNTGHGDTKTRRTIGRGSVDL